MDIILKNALVAHEDQPVRAADIAIEGESIVAVEAGDHGRGRRGDRLRRPARLGPTDRPARPSRCGAHREPGAQRQRHAARGHRRLGPAEEDPRPRIGQGPGQASDRLGGRPGRGLHPHPRRHLGRGPALDAGPAGGQGRGERPGRPADRRLSPGRHPLPPRWPGALPPRPRHGTGRDRRHPAQRGDAGGGRRQPQADLRRGGRSAAS